jgi:hypothetical protein
MIKPHFSSEEVAELGEAVFERAVAAKLRGHDLHHFVAIDVHSGEYEVDADAGQAIHRLMDRRPESRFWLRRVGSRVAHTFGPRLQFEPPWGDD